MNAKNEAPKPRRADDPERTFHLDGLCFGKLSEHPLKFRKGSDWGKPEYLSVPNRLITELGDQAYTNALVFIRNDRKVEWVEAHDTYIVVRVKNPSLWITVDNKVHQKLQELLLHAGLDAFLSATP